VPDYSVDLFYLPFGNLDNIFNMNRIAPQRGEPSSKLVPISVGSTEIGGGGGSLLLNRFALFLHHCFRFLSINLKIKILRTLIYIRINGSLRPFCVLRRVSEAE
jgi:hypothetical protein